MNDAPLHIVPDAPTSSLRGEMIDDRYLLGRELGRGGMGVVYEAFDSRLERKVAVKLLDSSNVSQPENLTRFRREALVTGRVGHPNICDVRDRGVTDEGVPFIVMELLEGESLGDMLLRKGKLPSTEAVDIALQVLDALGAAHDASIIHRDLKPANIFLTRGTAGRRMAKIVDFGISSFLEEKKNLAATATGKPMGTPLYMSPQQARGQKVDHRTDLWSVGAVLYAALTGRPPFSGENYNELMFAVAEEDPVRPRELTPTLPRPIEEVVLHALAKNPDDRFDDAIEFALTLSSAAGLPYQTTPTPPPVPLRPVLASPEETTLTGDSSDELPPVPDGGPISLPKLASPLEQTLTDDSSDELMPLEQPDSEELEAAIPEFDAVPQRADSRRAWALYGAIFVVCIGVGILAFMALNGGFGGAAADPGSPTPTQNVAAKVSIAFDSDPSGAEVWDTESADGPLGVTPFVSDFQRNDNHRTFELRKAGFLSKRQEVSLARDVRLMIALAREPDPVPAPDAATVEPDASATKGPEKTARPLRPRNGKRDKTKGGGGTQNATGTRKTPTGDRAVLDPFAKLKQARDLTDGGKARSNQ